MSFLINSILLLANRTQKVRNVAKYFHGGRHSNIIVFRTLSTSIKMSATNTCFKGKEDRYKGIIVNSEEEKCNDIKEFSKKLEDSLQAWTANEFRGIWFKVHIDQSDWVPILAKKGFKYHHAKEEYVMMYLWLPKTENSNIPHFAHTMLGVGAVVINNNNEVLVVKEKYSYQNLVYFKLPGGYVEPGENIVDAAIREVHEETNIMTEFQSVLTLRHTHGAVHNCSDIYIVLQLKPLSNEIIKCEREIAEAKWMDVKEYLNHPQITQLNKFFLRKCIEYKDNCIKINCFHGIHEVINKVYTMYSVTKGDTDENEKLLQNAKTKK